MVSTPDLDFLGLPKPNLSVKFRTPNAAFEVGDVIMMEVDGDLRKLEIMVVTHDSDGVEVEACFTDRDPTPVKWEVQVAEDLPEADLDLTQEGLER